MRQVGVVLLNAWTASPPISSGGLATKETEFTAAPASHFAASVRETSFLLLNKRIAFGTGPYAQVLEALRRPRRRRH